MVHRQLIYWLRHGAAWLAGRRRLVRITGESMRPTLEPGSWLWWTPAGVEDRRQRGPEPGEVILLRHPFHRDLRLVKRVERVQPDGRLHVTGDDPGKSTDSRHFGAVAPDRLLGRVHLPF